jgi:hypothetical protein
MEHLRGEIGEVTNKNSDGSTKKQTSGWHRCPSRANFMDTCEFIQNGIDTQPVETMQQNEVISVDNFERAIIRQFIPEDEHDATIVWQTKRSRLNFYLGAIMTIDKGVLDHSKNVPNRQTPQQPLSVINQNPYYWHRLEMLTSEQKDTYSRCYPRDNFGAKVTCGTGLVNNLHLLYFRLLLANFVRAAKNEIPTNGKKKKTILEYILIAEVANQVLIQPGFTFRHFFSKNDELTNFTKNFKSANKWMNHIQNWYTRNIESKWLRCIHVGHRAIKEPEKWDVMITQLEQRPDKSIDHKTDDDLATLWDNCEMGALQTGHIDGNLDWKAAVMLLQKGVVTSALITRLVSVREKWIWAKIQLAFPEGECDNLLQNRLGLNIDELMDDLCKYVRGDLLIALGSP